MTLSIDSFALKVIKKGEELAFSNKAKIINIAVPLKVKTYIEENLSKEVNHFKKKYKLEFNIVAENILVIPEYKIELQNKNKKVINKIENIEKIEKINFKDIHDRKNLPSAQFKKKFKPRGKFFHKNKYNPRIKKKNFQSKKVV
jgi:ribonuclease E